MGPAEDRNMTTGLHTVRDINCDKCSATLGWKYDKAFEASQRYKEGKYILERAVSASEQVTIHADGTCSCCRKSCLNSLTLVSSLNTPVWARLMSTQLHSTQRWKSLLAISAQTRHLPAHCNHAHDSSIPFHSISCYRVHSRSLAVNIL